MNMLKIYRKLMMVFGHMKVSKRPFWIQFHPCGYLVRGQHMRQVIEAIEPGDVLIRGYDQYPASRLIGYWSHAAIAISKNKIMHAIGTGVQEEDVLDFCRCDRVYILRPKINEQERSDVLTRALSGRDMPYDFLYRFNDGRELSCTEYVAHYCFNRLWTKLGIKGKFPKLLGFIPMPHMFTKFFGEAVLPEAFLDFPGFEPILKIDPRSNNDNAKTK